jgi:hypothetical protein
VLARIPHQKRYDKRDVRGKVNSLGVETAMKVQRKAILIYNPIYYLNKYPITFIRNSTHYTKHINLQNNSIG